jgi:hypothetical protein
MGTNQHSPNQVIKVVEESTGESFVLLDTDGSGNPVIKEGIPAMMIWLKTHAGPCAFTCETNARP